MCFVRPRSLWFALLLACGCAGSSRVAATADAQGDGAEDAEAAEVAETQEAERPAKDARTSRPTTGAAAKTEDGAPADGAAVQNPEPPHYTPEVTRAAVDNTAQAVDERSRLGLRLAVVERGPDTPWVYAIVNRGTEPVRVRPDLRTLSLEVTLPAPPPDPKRRKVTAPKPVRCALPKEQVPRDEESSPDVLLAPGEGIIDSFDPRLYCLSLGEKALVPEATVVARLGWSEKTKKVWSKGKAQTLVLDQLPPFVAQRELSAAALPEPPAPSQLKREPGTPPLSDEVAAKELVSQPFQLGSEYKKEESLPEPGPLKLEISRNADAATERDALLTATLSNIAKKPQRVLFRRELISFEISGPDGLVTCAPGPDDRSPDRQSIVSLRPGGRLRATSRLIELCPVGALRRPGLYLIHARFDSDVKGEAAQGVFDGRLLSHKPAVVRIRRGWGTLPKERQPERIRIGAP